jgi:hypothetical protein
MKKQRSKLLIAKLINAAAEHIGIDNLLAKKLLLEAMKELMELCNINNTGTKTYNM